MQNPRVRIKAPRDIRKMLLADEQVQMAVKQSRWRNLFTPDTILLTNQRVIRYSPHGFLGWRKSIEDYRYEDMANFKITKGIIFATVTIGHRFMSESLVLDGLPKGLMTDVSRVVEENIRRVRAGTPSPAASNAVIQDALETLKMRFARGEISQEQFEKMRDVLK